MEVLGSRSWRAPAVFDAAVACALATPSASAQVTEGCRTWSPTRRPTRCWRLTAPDGTTHLLLRFDGYVHNRGTGAFEMRGSQPVGTG